MKKQKSVALLIETSNAYARGLLSGIAYYIHEHELWSIFLHEQERGAPPPKWIANWDGDGVIARIENESIANVIRKLKIPVVDVSAARTIPDLPWVETNDAEIARMAYGHLRDRGFETFAYCGELEYNWSRIRGDEFKRCVTDAGFTCHVFDARGQGKKGYSIKRDRNRLSKWLLSLPRPIGMFASYDFQAQRVLDVCREFNVKVPGEVAILGVDNDELLCDLCTPPLSSVIPDAHATGRQAAELLDTLMAGGDVKRESRLVDPIGVATRQSTDVLAIVDPDISAAVRFIRDHCCEGINVADLVKQTSLTRRVLESRFQEIVGRTPHQEIMRRRIDRVRQLLVTTELTLAQIAHRTGFQHHEYMSVAFRREMETPPAMYRRNFRTRNRVHGL